MDQSVGHTFPLPTAAWAGAATSTHLEGSEQLADVGDVLVQPQRSVRVDDQAGHDGQSGDGEHQRRVVQVQLLLREQAQPQRPAG